MKVKSPFLASDSERNQVNLDEILNGRLSFMVIFVIWRDFFNTRPFEAGKKVKCEQLFLKKLQVPFWKWLFFGLNGKIIEIIK